MLWTRASGACWRTLAARRPAGCAAGQYGLPLARPTCRRLHAEHVPVQVTLFGKDECHLCDVVKAVLKRSPRQADFELRHVDISQPANAAWYARYRYDIPVVHLNGVYFAKHRISLDAFHSALDLAADGNLAPSPDEPDASTQTFD